MNHFRDAQPGPDEGVYTLYATSAEMRAALQVRHGIASAADEEAAASLFQRMVRLLAE